MKDESIPKSEAKRQLKAAFKRLAMYHVAMVEIMQEELGVENGTRLAEKVADRYGKMVGEEVLNRTTKQGKDNKLENYAEDLPLLAFEREHISDEPYRRKVHNCPLYETWRDMGKCEEGALYCRVDQAKFSAYNPRLACTHLVLAPRDRKPFCEMEVKETSGPNDLD